MNSSTILQFSNFDDNTTTNEWEILENMHNTSTLHSSLHPSILQMIYINPIIRSFTTVLEQYYLLRKHYFILSISTLLHNGHLGFVFVCVFGCFACVLEVGVSACVLVLAPVRTMSLLCRGSSTCFCLFLSGELLYCGYAVYEIVGAWAVCECGAGGGGRRSWIECGRFH